MQKEVNLVNLAGVICSNWEKVIAEAVFKYAGSVYNDITKLEELVASNSDTKKALELMQNIGEN